MSRSCRHDRRDFLALGAKLAGLGALALGGVGRPGRAFAQMAGGPAAPQDYKALVCVYLFGGNDGNNLVVPLDAERFGQYQRARGGLALGAGELLPPIADADGNPYAMHYGLEALQPLYESGELAFVFNVGLLERPLTRADFLAGRPAPTNLFSHSDQTVQAQTGMPTPNGSGWGGRLLECFGGRDSLAAVSVSRPALFLQGFDAGGNVIPPGGNLRLSGMSFWPAHEAASRRQAVDRLLRLDGDNPIRRAANQAMADGLELGDLLASNPGAVAAGRFPGTSIGRQLREVARLVRVRSSMGPGRQVFFCSMDGYDLHSTQDWTHWHLLSTLGAALRAFHDEMSEAGLSERVTTFTQSEFGRTLQPSGSGSDHGWGSHHIVLGGAVRGGMHGELPTLALGGPDDANQRGVWIPTTSTAQFGATLGRWFGASAEDLARTFPTLQNFPVQDVGFMGA